MAKTGPLSYQVKVAQNMVWRRHIDQLKNIDMAQKLHQDQEELAQAATTSENAPCDIDDSTQESPSSNLQRPERLNVWPIRGRNVMLEHSASGIVQNLCTRIITKRCLYVVDIQE